MRTSSYGKNKKPEKQKPQGVKKSVRYEMAPFYTEIETLQHTEGTALPETLWPKGIPDPSFGEDGAGGGSVRTVAGKIINFLIVRRSALLFRLTVRRKFFCVR